MNRSFGIVGVVVFTLLMSSGVASAQEPIQRGKIKSLDVAGRKVVIAAKDMEREFLLLEGMQVLGAMGKDLKEKLKDFKAGSEVLFKAGKKDGKDALVGIRLLDGKDPAAAPKVDTSKLKPLTDLGNGEYQGFKGGLYPDGKNERPAAHEAAGIKLARQVQPLNVEGQPAADGKIVLLSLGMSNTSQMSQGFQKLLAAESDKSPRLVFVNGAQGGMTASAIQDPASKTGERFWSTVDERLKSA